MKRSLATLAIATLALPLAACGKDEGEPIPSDQADALVRVLTTAKRQSEAGSCQTLLRDTIPSLHRRAEALPSSVGTDVRETITDGIDHLQTLAEDQCAPEEEPTTTEEPTTDTSETTEPTTDTTEPTTDTTGDPTDATSDTDTSETTPPDTSETTPTTPTTPTLPTTPPENGGDTAPPDNPKVQP